MNQELVETCFIIDNWECLTLSTKMNENKSCAQKKKKKKENQVGLGFSDALEREKIDLYFYEVKIINLF